MGDDELNFTADEAAEWASDPRNQAHKDAIIWPIIVMLLVVCVILLLIMLSWPATPSGLQKGVPLALRHFLASAASA